MSKLTEKLQQKFKDRRSRTASPSGSSGSPSRSGGGLPSFRFSAADEELIEIPNEEHRQHQLIKVGLKDDDDEVGQGLDTENSSAGKSQGSSPVRETLLNKISTKFSSSSIASNDNSNMPQPQAMHAVTNESNHDHSRKESWLHTVKGKIAQKVEEKYTEYKNEKELRKLINTSSGSAHIFNIDDDFFFESPEIEDEDEENKQQILPHSYSEDSVLDSSNMSLSLRRSSTPVISDDVQAGQRSGPQSPKERRKFTFSFLDRSGHNAKPANESEASAVLSTSSTSPTPNAGSVTTPTKSSLRFRVMEKFMGKTPVDEPKVGVKNVSSNMSALDKSLDDPEATEKVPEDSDIETAVEADELLTFESGNDNNETMINKSEHVPDEHVQVEHFSQTLTQWIQGYWWSLGLPACFLLFLQILPLPTWIIGFVTGILIAIPTAVYVTYTLMDDKTPRTPFVENVERKQAERPAIIVQEELNRIYTWMNLWPLKKGPYDPLTYDVRRTISVRIMLHGPWLEMRFPKRNLALRRMHNDIEPTNVQFHEHVEVIDLSTCSIDIQPDNLPTKRIWSKKYPIRIRANTRKPFSTEEATQKMAAHADIKDEAEMDDDEEMQDAKESLDDDEEVNFDKAAIEIGEDKIFYLFARTAREKEEWFNHLLIAAKFMEDWEHQNPKEGAKYDPDYETYKVKEQKYKMFMEDYPQAKNAEEARKRHEEIKTSPELLGCAKDQTAFLNIFFARMWHDLHNNKAFTEFLREKLTRKLLKVKISQYFEEVKVTTLDLGPKLPQILSCSTPWQDELGIWFDLDIDYQCICQATVQTQGIRLPAKDEPDREAAELLSRQAAVLDSDEEDSAEVHSSSWHSYLNTTTTTTTKHHNNHSSSSGRQNLHLSYPNLSLLKEDDEVPESDSNPGSGPNTPGSHELPPLPGFKARLVEGILRSDFVAKMAESEWVKKNITSKNITLQLQLHSVKGTLSVNFPPAPSDRIWYGFREPPQLDLALRPCFGGHSLGKYEGTIATVMKHLEKRLKVEFIKVLVCPNMDDEVLPFLHHVPYSLSSGKDSQCQPTSIYVPKIKPSQSLQNFNRN